MYLNIFYSNIFNIFLPPIYFSAGLAFTIINMNANRAGIRRIYRVETSKGFEKNSAVFNVAVKSSAKRALAFLEPYVDLKR